MELICIVCPRGCHLTVGSGGFQVSGQGCEKGVQYAKTELTNPTRTVTSTVTVKGAIAHTRLPVKTDAPISKQLVIEAVRLLDNVTVTAPIKCGEDVLKNILGSGVNFVATRSM